MDYIEHDGLFETTPELFAQWLYRETFKQWPDNSIVSEFASYPPEFNEVEHGISLGVELIPSDNNEPVTVRNTIRFWMLQISESPNKTHIHSKCRTGILQIDRGATIDYKNAVDCFEELWERIHSQFTCAGVSQAEKLWRTSEFDASVHSVVEELNQVKSEDTFINNILKPLFEVMGYEGVTRLHHTGRSEDGKDIVFFERNQLGGLNYYAVVACVGKIHADSSKTRDSGHYQKIIDQVNKCFTVPYVDYNTKGEFHIDKVVVTCTANITEPALKLFHEWEKAQRRHLVFWDAERIAGHKLRVHLK